MERCKTKQRWLFTGPGEAPRQMSVSLPRGPDGKNSVSNLPCDLKGEPSGFAGGKVYGVRERAQWRTILLCMGPNSQAFNGVILPQDGESEGNMLRKAWDTTV